MGRVLPDTTTSHDVTVRFNPHPTYGPGATSET